MFTVRCSNVQRQKLVFEFNCQEMNMFCVRSMFKVLFDEHLVNIIMPKILRPAEYYSARKKKCH